MAGEKSGGQQCSVLQVPGTYGPAETNCDGNVKHRCANCASKAKHSQKATTKKALNEPGSNNSTISVTTGSDLPTNCHAYLQRRTDSKALLFVIL